MVTVSAVAMLAGGARAACAPAGGPGPDAVTCDAPGDGLTYSAGGGNDTIDIVSGTYTGTIQGGAGDDTITLDGTADVNVIQGNEDADNIVLLSGSVANANAGAGEDTITLDGATVSGSLFGGTDADTFNLLSGSAAGVFGDAGADTFTLDGAAISGNISGADDADVFNLLSGSAVNVNGGIGADIITLDGAALSGNITGGADADTFNLLSGSAVGAFGDAGNDTFTLDGAALSGNISGADGADIFNLLSGSAVNVNGGIDGDTFTLDGAAISGNISGGDGVDTIDLFSGSAAAVLGDSGADTITLDGATVSGNISGGDGTDTIGLLSGSALNVNGGNDADIITLDGAAISGTLNGGPGDDSFFLNSGSFGGALSGVDGSDTATIASTFDLTTIAGPLDGGDDTGTLDGFIDTLNIEAAGTLSGVDVINWETINLNLGGGTLLLTGGSVVTSAEDGFGLFINSGALDLGTGYAITGDTQINGGGTLLARTAGGGGAFSISEDLRNFGAIDMSGGTPAAGDVLTAGGNYVGGGSLILDAALDATMLSDMLVVNGTVSGTTTIIINDTAPLSPSTVTGTGPGAGIALVDNSGGAGIAAGNFSLAGGQIVKGPNAYTLSLEADNILYLQSDLLGQVSGYGILSEVMREAFPTLRDRLGDRRYNGFGDDGTPDIGLDNAGVWVRLDGHQRDIEGSASTAPWEQTRGEAEVGLDIPMEAFGGVGVFGISLHAVQGYATVSGTDEAKIESTGFGAGVGYAWFPGGGFYADVQGRVTSWATDVVVNATGLEQEFNGIGWGTSLEVGNRIPLGARTAVTPRGQVVYSDVHFDGFTDDNGVTVSQGDSASIVFSGGVTIETLFPDNGLALFADASLSHDLLSDSSVNVSGLSVRSGLDDTWGTFAVGASVDVADGTSAFVAADVSSAIGSNFGDSTGYGLKAGVRIDF